MSDYDDWDFEERDEDFEDVGEGVEVVSEFSDEVQDTDECVMIERRVQREYAEGMDEMHRLREAGENYIVREAGFKGGKQHSLTHNVYYDDPKMQRRMDIERLSDENKWLATFTTAFGSIIGVNGWRNVVDIVNMKNVVKEKVPRWVKTNPTLMVCAMACDTFVDGDFEKQTTEWYRRQVANNIIDPKMYTLFDVQRYTLFWYKVALKK